MKVFKIVELPFMFLQGLWNFAKERKPPEKSAIRVFSSLALTFSNGLFMVALARYCRPAWRVLLRLTLKRYESLLRKQPSSPKFQKSVMICRFMLLYDQKAAWSELLPLIEAFEVKTRMTVAADTFYLYWVNERFDEARQACEYWQNIAEQWISEHEGQAKQARSHLRKLWSWKLGYPARSKGTHETIMTTMQEASRLGGSWVREYHEAKFAGLMLAWLEERGYAPAHEYLTSHKLNRNASFFVGFNLIKDFGYAVAQELGMDDSTFMNLCRQAEQW
jgi:hypothetical protein